MFGSILETVNSCAVRRHKAHGVVLLLTGPHLGGLYHVVSLTSGSGRFKDATGNTRMSGAADLFSKSAQLVSRSRQYKLHKAPRALGNGCALGTRQPHGPLQPEHPILISDTTSSFPTTVD